MDKPLNVDAYIESASAPAQPLLRDLRNLVLETAPAAVEQISYGMPTYRYRGESLLNLSAAKNHVSVHGLVHVDGDVPQALAGYLHHRSTLRFQFGSAIPAEALCGAIRDKVEGLEVSK